MILSCRYGKFAVPECSDLIVDSLCDYGEWAQEEINILSHFIEHGNIVVDAGSFIGTHARAFSKMVGKNGKVYAFEPNDSIFPYLKENAERAVFSNIVVYPLALGATNETQALVNEFNENQGGTRLVSYDSKNSPGLVNVKPLDECGIERIDFIKADVEGMELSLLKGAERLINICRPVIFVEANSLEAAYSVVEWVRQRNYRVYGVITMAFNPHNFHKAKDNIFGQSKECGLLLINAQDNDRYISTINMLSLPEIVTADDLVLLLLHKPQYAYEVLEKSKVASVFGIEYPSPGENKVVAECNSRTASLNQRIDDTEQAKDFAEKLALQRLVELEEHKKHLSLTQNAKGEAERLALERLAELEKQKQQLVLTQNAKNEAERLALQRLAEIEEYEQRLSLIQNDKEKAERLALKRLEDLEEYKQRVVLIQNDKNNVESKLRILEAQLDTIHSSRVWRLATKVGLITAKGRKPHA